MSSTHAASEATWDLRSVTRVLFACVLVGGWWGGIVGRVSIRIATERIASAAIAVIPGAVLARLRSAKHREG